MTDDRDAQATPITDAPDDILEWVYHMDLHLTQHDVRHAGLALRSAWPHVRAYLYATMLRADTVSELRDKRLIENGLLKLKLSNAEAALTAATARAEELEHREKVWRAEWESITETARLVTAEAERGAVAFTSENGWTPLGKEIVRLEAELDDVIKRVCEALGMMEKVDFAESLNVIDGLRAYVTARRGPNARPEEDRLTSRVAALERETIERAAKVLDAMHEHISDGWDYYSDERSDGAHNALTNGTKAIRALALRATEQQQQGKP